MRDLRFASGDATFGTLAARLGIGYAASGANGQDTLDACPHAGAFFESGPGLAYLHRPALAFHVVCVDIGACGIRLGCLFLQMTGHHRFVGASCGMPQRLDPGVEEVMGLTRVVAQSIRAIGHTYPFVDLDRGIRRNGKRIASDIQQQIDTIRTIAHQEGLSETCMERIEKTERVVPTMQATIEFVSTYVRQPVSPLEDRSPGRCLPPYWKLSRHRLLP